MVVICIVCVCVCVCAYACSFVCMTHVLQDWRVKLQLQDSGDGELELDFFNGICVLLYNVRVCIVLLCVCVCVCVCVLVYMMGWHINHWRAVTLPVSFNKLQAFCAPSPLHLPWWLTGFPPFPKLPSIMTIPVMFIKKNQSFFVYVVSEATRNSLRGRKFQNFPGGACPQTP